MYSVAKVKFERKETDKLTCGYEGKNVPISDIERMLKDPQVTKIQIWKYGKK